MKNKETVLLALKTTFPVFLGYTSIGIAFGILFVQSGNSIIEALSLSVFTYAGSLQYLSVSFFQSGISYLSICMLTILLNIRHIFYGISFFDLFRKHPQKPYLIFSLTDETYALFSTLEIPEHINRNLYILAIAAFNQTYWVIGTLIGAIGASMIHFNAQGIEFAMTALFLVLFLDQWQKSNNHFPALLGLFSTIASLLLFRAYFIPLSIAIIISILTWQYFRSEAV